MNRSIMLSTVLVLFLLSSNILCAQEALKPRPSPMYQVTLKNGETYIKITYCRPSKNGREIFGGLVPYGTVWRTGANEATEITTTRDISFGNKKLKSGTYTLFSIPEKDSWTIILNKELGQWGAYQYNETLDVLRIEVPVSVSPEVYEAFTIDFKQNNGGADLQFIWDKTLVTVPISFQ